MTADEPANPNVLPPGVCASGWWRCLRWSAARARTAAGLPRAAGGKSRDPLVYGPNRIPPQNVPVPDRGGIGAKGTKTDPLIDAPTGRPGDKTASATRRPERFKGPYIPGPGSTPAARGQRQQ